MAKVKVNLKRHIFLNDRRYDAGEYYVSEAVAEQMRDEDVKREGKITFPDEVVVEREKAKAKASKTTKPDAATVAAPTIPPVTPQG
jgi:hypothetical protein